MEKLKAVLLDTAKKTVNVVEIDNDLESIYIALNCDCFDIARRKVGNEWYDIFCDDIGLWKPGNPPSAIRGDDVELVGNLLLTRDDGRGNQISLTDTDIENIYDNIVCAVDMDWNCYPVVVVNY